MEYVWYVLAGIVSGVIAGMGMGGGTLLIPILTIFFALSQTLAQGINLFSFLPCAIFSLIVHIKNGLVNFKTGIPIISAGVLSSFGASFLALGLKNELLQILFGLFLLIIGLLQATIAIVTIVKNKKNIKSRCYAKCYYKFKKSPK